MTDYITDAAFATEVAALPIATVDHCRLGKMVIHLVLAAAMAHHEHPQDTLRDYVSAERSADPGSAAAMTFLRDVFTRTTTETAERWFGGEFMAVAMAARTLDAWYCPAGEGA